MQETTDESDETLSLCDLPLYSDHQSVEGWQGNLSSESQGSSSISSSEQDYFEFSSQQLSPSTTTSFPPKSIVFCGKLIPYKLQPYTSDEDSSKLVENKSPTNNKKRRGWRILRWIFSLSKNNQDSTTLVHKDQSSPKKTYNSNKHGEGCDYAVHKMSLITSSSSSSSSGEGRRYLLGISRFSSEVQLKDIKSRLSSRHNFPSPQPLPATLSSSSGMWGLIRVLSCGSNYHPNTTVVASTIYSPQY
ncbi:hypothetical protein OROMI_001459 [Orobanche minor]